MNKNALVILVKNPTLGAVKTRLAAEIGDEEALLVYKALLKYTRFITQDIQCSRLLFYSDYIDSNDGWQNETYIKFLQKGNDFGERMCNAFQVALSQHISAVIIGSDCFELTSEIIEYAFIKLEEYDVVIGPAKDGGYYLMGLKEIYPELFLDKNWSTSSVLSDTLTDLNHLGLSVFFLPVLSDIDNLEDLKNSNLIDRFNLELLKKKTFQ